MHKVISVLKHILTVATILTAVAGQAHASSEKIRQNAERVLAQEVIWFQQVVVYGSHTEIRLRQASIPLIEAVGIWDDEDNLIFPDQEAAPHIYDVAITHNLDRLHSLRRAAQPNAWEAYDIDVDSLLFCSNNLSATCLLINTDELSKLLEVDRSKLTDALFGSESSTSYFSWLYLLPFAIAAGFILFRTERKAPLNTQQVDTNHLFKMGDMEIDPKRMLITRNSFSTSISARDLKLLTCLFEHPDEVISKDTLYNAGWGRDFVPSSRSLEQHIMTLRKKIDPERNLQPLIETVHGQGYRFPSNQP